MRLAYHSKEGDVEVGSDFISAPPQPSSNRKVAESLEEHVVTFATEPGVSYVLSRVLTPADRLNDLFAPGVTGTVERR